MNATMMGGKRITNPSESKIRRRLGKKTHKNLGDSSQNKTNLNPNTAQKNIGIKPL